MLKSFLSSLIFLSLSGCVTSPVLANVPVDSTLSLSSIKTRLQEEMILIDYEDQSTLVFYTPDEDVYYMLAFANSILSSVSTHTAGEMMEILDGGVEY